MSMWTDAKNWAQNTASPAVGKWIGKHPHLAANIGIAAAAGVVLLAAPAAVLAAPLVAASVPLIGGTTVGGVAALALLYNTASAGKKGADNLIDIMPMSRVRT